MSDPEILQFLAQPDIPLFSDLHSLSLIDNPELRLGTVLFSRLTHLRLVRVQSFIHPGPVNSNLNDFNQLLDQLPDCPDLDHLELDVQCYDDAPPYSPVRRLSGLALVRIAEKYRNLRVLKLCQEVAGFDGTDITDAHFDHMASLLPHLVALTVWLKHSRQSLTIQCLESLARHCRDLE